MTSDLRPYQEECLEVIHKTFQNQPAQLVQLPTGSGKTRIFIEYIARHCESALIIVPTIDLKMQVLSQVRKYIPNKRVSVNTAAMLKSKSVSRLYDNEFDLIIFDEAHRAQCPTYMNFMQDYNANFGTWRLLGMTATPERADKKPLLDIFGSLSFSRSIIDMINEGYLANLRAYRHDTKQSISTREVQNGDFMLKALRKLDNPTRNSLILKVLKDHCVDKKTLVFCVDILHCETIAKELKMRGYKAEAIHGNLNSSQRAQILNKFREGKIQILTNCQLLTEGFDEPSIETVIMARPTRSKTLYCQMVGRGTRLSPGKTYCEIHELTDNAFKICTFDVCAGREPEPTPRQYTSGISLTERSTELLNIDTSNLELVPKEIDLFQANDLIENLPIMEHQKAVLEERGYRLFPDSTYLEGAFLIWELKMLKIYNLQQVSINGHYK